VLVLGAILLLVMKKLTEKFVPPTFAINQQCEAMWCYRVHENMKIVFQPGEQDFKSKMKTQSNMLRLQPTLL
jgi:hypothetical protein